MYPSFGPFFRVFVALSFSAFALSVVFCCGVRKGSDGRSDPHLRATTEGERNQPHTTEQQSIPYDTSATYLNTYTVVAINEATLTISPLHPISLSLASLFLFGFRPLSSAESNRRRRSDSNQQQQQRDNQHTQATIIHPTHSH